MPYGAIPTATAGVNVSWRGATYPYIKSVQIFACPSYRNNTSNADFDGPAVGLPNFPQSYAANGMQHTVNGSSNNQVLMPLQWKGVAPNLSAIASVATTVAVVETANSYPVYDTQDGPTTNNQDYATRMEIRHLQTGNFLFADGHVKAMKASATCKGAYSWTLDGSACRSELISSLAAADVAAN